MKPLYLPLILSLVSFSFKGFADSSVQLYPPAKKPYPYGPSKKEAQKPQEAPPPIPIDYFANDSYSFRFSAKHKEANGIGYDLGYSSLDGFFTFSSIGNWHPFFDLRAHLFNDGRPAANAGFGIRYLPETVPVVFGINGFFDFKHTRHSTFEQAGLGIEVLGANWEMRANGYVPLFGNKNLYAIYFEHFQGHHAIFRADSELGFKGFDLSIGRSLVRQRLWDLSTTLGGYMFFASYGQEARGGLLKFKSNLTPYFSIETTGSYDNLFKGILQIQAAFNVPFGKQVKNKTKGIPQKEINSLANRIIEEVDRFEIIVSKKHHKESLGRDPRTGHPLEIIFVNNTAENEGSGTVSSPYRNLSKAEHHSSSWDMIYVYGGDGTPKHMKDGIHLKDGQWLQGSSTSFILNTSFGSCSVPSQTSMRPSIQNGEGDCVILSDNTIVSGFDIRSKDSNIKGTHIHNATIKHNHLIVGTDYDIAIADASGKIIVADNKSSSLRGLSILANKDVNLKIKDNSFSNKLNNLLVNISGHSKAHIEIEGNSIKDSNLGSLLISSQNAKVSTSISHNHFTNISAPFCLKATTSGSSISNNFVENNLFSSPSGSLFLQTNLQGNAHWNVLRNTGHYTGSNPPVAPFYFDTDSISTGKLLLKGNYANSAGYQLTNESILSTFKAISPTHTLRGIEDENTGSFDTTGMIRYTSP